MNPSAKLPLYVDLDGTFIKSDMLFESLFCLLKQHPLKLFSVPFWLLKGKAHLKNKINESIDIDISSIPVNEQTLAYLKKAKLEERKVVLATASNQGIAKKFVSQYDVFDDYVASDPKHNLKGKNKTKKIQSIDPDFAYMGNSSEDFEVFCEAQHSVLVNPTKKAKRLHAKHPVDEVLESEAISTLKVWKKQLRLHQWVKNFLIFVPILVSSNFTQISLVVATILGFVFFGMLASATYIVNDLLDLDNDRVHRTKKDRPLAACKISIPSGIMVAFLMTFIAFAGALLLSLKFAVVLLAYLFLTLSYSLKLKRYFAMDVIALAGLYTIRIFAGAALIGVNVSFWLLSFSMFIFLSLALVKRCTELVAIKQQNKDHVSGRDYSVTDLTVFTSFGATSAMMSLLMYCFYMESGVLADQYQEPDLLWLSLPALGYWLMRMWVKTLRGEMHDDPIVYSLKDHGSIVALSFVFVTTVLALLL
ncbi:UbiA family prenyltransferase [Glaciecola sp. 1036]|uniref:UbiA family prenyltransferase n=1 Tax=Alteromonadaceae TaxID=72275 RepID=UPI003D0563D6